MITLADPCSSSKAEDVHLTANFRVPARYLIIRYAASMTLTLAAKLSQAPHTEYQYHSAYKGNCFTLV